ncbi:LrgB family protein [Bacillus massiliglaciei]|uniref:LrgB family protein n=1 Tax=Bacillus massiliglaciei TaxID=1816693 RepID=UPI000A9018EA|nr:LrgB family protein [Bacillus massiliglaciei]
MTVPITIFNILLTAGAYLAGRKIYARFPTPFTTPVFFCIVVIITIFSISGIDYNDYKPAKDFISFFLGPATIALAVPLYKNREIIRKFAVPALCGIIFGLAVTLFTAILIGKAFFLSFVMLQALAVKSVTVPIAIEIMDINGGDQNITASFVILTGVLGTMLAPWIMDKIHIKDPFSRGIAYGTIAHGLGTAQASQESEFTGAVAGAAMAIAGIVISLVYPMIQHLL